MEQSKWSERLTSKIGARIQELRKAQGLSAQDLSAATADLGEEIPRQVITNLENGRRASISVAELTLLAAALRTSPLEVLFPGVDAGTTIEWLPGRHESTYVAREGFAGLDGGLDSNEVDYLTVRSLISSEKELLKMLVETIEMRKEGHGTATFGVRLKLIATTASTVHSIRRLVTSDGATLPEPNVTIAELYRLPEGNALAEKNLEILIDSWVSA